MKKRKCLSYTEMVFKLAETRKEMNRTKQQEKVIKELKRLNESHLITVQKTEAKRRVFNHSEEMFKLFGEMDAGVLDPFNDYSYEWLNSFLYNVIDLLERQDFDSWEELEETIQSDLIYEWADSETDVYTSDLTKWLSHSNDNTYYLDEAHQESQGADNILMIAQCTAITELFNNALALLIEYLNEYFEFEEVV